jgi:large conductance mechanosensitive channel
MLMSFVGEFKTFAMRGNVVDLAVGVVIGAAFGRIVTALVDGIIMPVIGLLVGGVHFGDLALRLKAAEVAADGSIVTPAVLFEYGAFLQTLFDFFIIALAIFLLVRLMNRMRRKEEEKPAPVAELSTEARLLAEIRDALIAR